MEGTPSSRVAEILGPVVHWSEKTSIIQNYVGLVLNGAKVGCFGNRGGVYLGSVFGDLLFSWSDFSYDS